ncbi:hypothetical protein ATANTOWER_014692 [Ataeniobius toweri]|uniref:Uncharacterized protein n=1 Tax=Ataeniobius toweri TaxID=208326 RepID=A0ABU7C9V3_9TELE|nr:hypothetical protein [Ataeniobius toweri]
MLLQPCGMLQKAGLNKTYIQSNSKVRENSGVALPERKNITTSMQLLNVTYTQSESKVRETKMGITLNERLISRGNCEISRLTSEVSEVCSCMVCCACRVAGHHTVG